MKKIIRIMLTAIMTASLLIGNTATADSDIRVTLNGTNIQFDTSPVIRNERTLVPIRAIFEAMDMGVSWDNSTKKILATSDNMIISMEIGSVVYASGSNSSGTEVHVMDVAPCIIDDRTYVPVRFIAEATGYTVNWNDGSKTVEITGSPKAAEATPKPTPKPKLYDDLGTDFNIKGSLEFYKNTLEIVDFGKLNNSEARNVTESELDGAYETTMSYTTTRDDVLNYISALKSYGFETGFANESDSRIDFNCDKMIDISTFKQEKIRMMFYKDTKELYIDAYSKH